jgi:hypothetical protein
MVYDILTAGSLLTKKAHHWTIRGLLEEYPTFGREKETGLPGALDT